MAVKPRPFRTVAGSGRCYRRRRDRGVTKMEAGAAAPPPFWAGGPAPGQIYIPKAWGQRDTFRGAGTATGPAAGTATRTL